MYLAILTKEVFLIKQLIYLKKSQISNQRLIIFCFFGAQDKKTDKNQLYENICEILNLLVNKKGVEQVFCNYPTAFSSSQN